MTDQTQMHEIYPVTPKPISNPEVIGPGIDAASAFRNLSPPRFDAIPEIKLRKLRETARVPSFGSYSAACFDLSAAFEKDLRITSYSKYNVKDVTLWNGEYFTVYPGDRALIPTGWVFELPLGYSMRIHPRSGLALKEGITLANAEAVIDEDYIQETYVMIQNNSKKNLVVTDYMRLAQAELVKKIDVLFTVSDEELTQKGNRTGGFGSSGI